MAGEARVIGGTTYIASALDAPGVIEQTGTHRRMVFGEVFGALPRSSQRVAECTRRFQAPTSSRKSSATAGYRSGRSSSSSCRSPVLPAHRGCLSDRSGRILSPERSSWRHAAKSRASPAPKASRSPRRHREDRKIHRGDPGHDALVAADRSGAGEEDRGRGASRRCRPTSGRCWRAGADHFDPVRSPETPRGGKRLGLGTRDSGLGTRDSGLGDWALGLESSVRN